MIRAREPEADEMVRTGHDLVVELRIQETLDAGGAIGSAGGSESRIDEVTPVAVDNGKVAQDFSGRSASVARSSLA